MDDERLAELLTRRSPAAAAGDCPDADVVAGLVERRLAADERAVLVRHLAGCPACRQWVSELDEVCADSTGAGGVRGRLLGFPWKSLAAVAAVAAVAVVWWSAQGETRLDDTALIAAVDDLRERNGGVFAGFEPVGPAERARPGAAVERGGLRLEWPRGALLRDRPHFVWPEVAGAGSYTLTVRTADGSIVLRKETSDPGFGLGGGDEPLPAGDLVWRVEATGPSGTTSGSAAIRILSPDEMTRYQDGDDIILRTAPERMRPALQANWALHWGLLRHAHLALTDGGPPDGGWTEVEQETLGYIVRRIGD